MSRAGGRAADLDVIRLAVAQVVSLPCALRGTLHTVSHNFKSIRSKEAFHFADERAVFTGVT